MDTEHISTEKKTETRREWKQNQRLLEFNKNKYTAYTYVYRLNVVFRGKLIALSIYIKMEISHMRHLIAYVEDLEQKK